MFKLTNFVKLCLIYDFGSLSPINQSVDCGSVSIVLIAIHVCVLYCILNYGLMNRQFIVPTKFKQNPLRDFHIK